MRFAMLLSLLAGSAAQAEIFLTAERVCLPRLPGGLQLIQSTISAVGTEGEQISTFSFLNLQGRLHQVQSVGLFDPLPTPDRDAMLSGGPGFLEINRAYDTQFLIGGDDLIGVVGGRLEEGLSDGSTTGLLPLEPIVVPSQSFVPPSGFTGSLRTRDGAYALTPAAASDNVAFLQIVHEEGEGFLLDLQVDAPGASASFSGFTFGLGAPPLDCVPEPSSLSLLAIGLISRRRPREVRVD